MPDKLRDFFQEFLDLCTGVKGLKILRQRVTVLHVLPADSTRLADESSLVIMDIVVELSDGSIANVEVQRIGYPFRLQEISQYLLSLFRA